MLKRQKIVPGKTLLFFDEIQIAPKAIQALRYFYEVIPDLHVIAAGSLIEFEIGLPVGRVESIYLRPLSFLEFLAALGEEMLISELINGESISAVMHKRCLELFGDYLFIGGMPEVVAHWKKSKNSKECRTLQQQLIAAYRADFHKYAKSTQYKYLDLLFEAIPSSIGKKFVFSRIAEGIRKRDVDPCVELLVRAGVLHKVVHTSAHALPLAAGSKPDRFKLIMGDIGLLYAIARHLHDISWESLWNKGEIIESAIGQECLAYQDPYYSDGLYYWHREKRASSAEVDYLFEIDDYIVPIEVKSGDGRSLRSLKTYLENADRSPVGYRLSLELSSDGTTIKNLPLYAVFLLFLKHLHERLLLLLSDEGISTQGDS